MDASFCKQCQDKTCLKTKKPCEAVEALLRDDGVWDAKWIRPRVASCKRRDGYGPYREIPFSSLGVDETGGKDPIMKDES
jgi:hypothetical protein